MKFSGKLLTLLLCLLLLATTSPLSCDLPYSEIESAALSWQSITQLPFPKMREASGNQLSYAIAYRLGVEAERAKEIALAYAYYTRAGYRNLSLNLQVQSAELAMLTWRKQGSKGRSPLFAEAAIKLAHLAYNQKDYHPMLWFLEVAELSPESPLWLTALRLRGLALLQLDKAKAYSFYQKEAYLHKDPEMLLSLAEAYHSDGITAKAVETYFAVMEYPWLDTTYLQATRRILTVYSNWDFSPAQKVRLAEGCRMLKEYEKAHALYAAVNPTHLPKEILVFYYQNLVRLLLDQKRYAEAVTVVQEGLSLLPKEAQEQLLSDASERLVKPDRYQEILAIVPPKTIHRIAALNRLKALYKEKHPNRLEEALFYLNYHDRESYYAEKVAFSQCLEHLLNQQENLAEQCLWQLAEATQGVKTGGNARYHLGKLYSVQGKTEAALKMYRSIYLNYADDYLLGRALEAGKQSQVEKLPQKASETQLREWIAANAGHESALAEFLQRKKKDPTFALSPVWLTLEKELQEIPQQLSLLEKKGALLYVLGLKSQALAYLKSSPKIVTTLLLYRLAELTKDTSAKLYYLKQYIKEKSIVADLFFMSHRAIESLYPIPWFSEVKAAAKKFGVEEAKIYAIMKQESQFNPKAQSPANAQGLMQLLPSTAKLLNYKLKIKKLNLFLPEHSILLGTKFYADLSTNYSDIFEKVAVAYNAGPGRLIELSRTLSEDLDYFIEQIPIHQTHHYVKATRAEYDRYRWLLKYYYDTN